ICHHLPPPEELFRTQYISAATVIEAVKLIRITFFIKSSSKRGYDAKRHIPSLRGQIDEDHDHGNQNSDTNNAIQCKFSGRKVRRIRRVQGFKAHRDKGRDDKSTEPKHYKGFNVDVSVVVHGRINHFFRHSISSRMLKPHLVKPVFGIVLNSTHSFFNSYYYI